MPGTALCRPTVQQIPDLYSVQKSKIRWKPRIGLTPFGLDAVNFLFLFFLSAVSNKMGLDSGIFGVLVISISTIFDLI